MENANVVLGLHCSPNLPDESLRFQISLSMDVTFSHGWYCVLVLLKTIQTLAIFFSILCKSVKVN